MKKLLLSIFLFCALAASSQDTLKIRHIDSLVRVINQSNLKAQRDSIFQDHPDFGLSMKTYLTMIVDGTELKKYVNDVHTTRIENGISRQILSTNVFYFDKNKLIKAEDVYKEGDKDLNAEWYYWDDKPLYYTLLSPKSGERANFLLTLSRTLVKQAIK
jgi:hypothetical protein